MSESRNYQRKARISNKRVVFCNWKRGSGKTFSIAEEICYDFFGLKENKDIIIVFSANKDIEHKAIYDFLIELLAEEGICIMNTRNKIEITSRTNKVCTIKFISLADFLNCKEMIGINRIDKVYCDEFIPSKSDIECILRFSKQIKIFTTYIDNEDFEYISDVEDFTDKKKWISTEIEELMKEYSSIRKADNTTMRREKVLYQIKILKELFDVK